ncbi:E3 ubiquitin-protein ligase TRAIP-like [Macrosteles quadrilineatus]|uniref:E3 ubiquitin-protein ligase TRAIP-like n=1 Tax=Macrosteles quadrilineatus TaxID=74068 RepID=UPI0023E3402A|nr:E3 ubiquitin-protein ligase TRAIP-like [Macrosteles quadrilineatus]
MFINCTICSDLFTGQDSEVVYATSCGHLFHQQCLLQWYERSPTCPQCREKQRPKNAVKVYFSVPSNFNCSQDDASALQNKVDSLNFQIKLKDTDLKNQKEDNDKLKFQTKGLREEVKKMRDELNIHQQQTYSYLEKIKTLKRECKQLNEYKLEADELRKQLDNYKGLEELLHGSATDTEEILIRTALDPTTLSMCVSTFKKELEASKHQKLELRELLVTSQKEANKLKAEVKKLNEDISIYKRVNQKLKEDVACSEEDIASLKQKIKQLQSAISSPGESNPRDKALRRLLQENPAPANIANSLDNSFVVSPPSKPSKMSYSPPSPGIAIRKRKEAPMSIFQKPNRALDPDSIKLSQSGQGSETVYNGLGGHSRSDDFAFPKFDRFKKLTKKKNLSAAAASTAKKLKPDPNNLKLDSFFS